MPNFFHDNADLDYYFRAGIDWERLVALSEHGHAPGEGFDSCSEAVAFYREIASRVGEFSAQEVAPHAAQIDREGVLFERGEVGFPPRLQSISDKARALGLHAVNLPRELGGMNAPLLLYYLSNELLARADISVMAHFGFHAGTALAMLLFSALEGSTELAPNTGRILETRWRGPIEEIASGHAWGSMDITEPDAGSDLAALRTRAEQDPDGTWRITGQKVFITSGHGKYHFVLARSEPAPQPEDPKAGLAGLSLFLVRAYADAADGRRTRFVSLDRVEDKLGHHASATVGLSFERTPAELVGKRGEGFRLMLELMNHARIGVAFESIGLCEAALRMARDYAGERRVMGKPIAEHELIADYLEEMETDIAGLRALAIDTAFRDEVAQKSLLFARFMDPRERSPAALEGETREEAARVRRATPLLKYLAAEKAVEMARRCLQIHGGNGYMREYGAEKLLRDAAVLPIYEGTSQIQALMAMRDTLIGISKAPRTFAKRVMSARWRALSARDALERRVARVQQLSASAQQHLITRTFAARMKTLQGLPLHAWRRGLFEGWDPKRDFALALLHAERLTRLLADEAIVEVLLGQAQRHPERRPLLERYLDRAEPRARFCHDEITSRGQLTLARTAAPAAAQLAAE